MDSPPTRASSWSAIFAPETRGGPEVSASVRRAGQTAASQLSNIYYQASAEFIHDCYIGHIDAQINDQYRSLHGSLRFLHNIVRFPGCGVFEESASWLLLDPATSQFAGIVLCSRVAPRVAHITQLCIAPRSRGQGLAKHLLRHAMRHLQATGFDAITLTVTEVNHEAVSLYEQMGFTTRHNFDAMVLDKAPGF